MGVGQGTCVLLPCVLATWFFYFVGPARSLRRLVMPRVC